MNVRGTFMCLLCVGALFVACGSKSRKTAEVAGQADTVHVVGDDKDKHGCIASAGYTWSEAQKDCIRLWEKGVRMNAVDDAEKMLFLVFSPDSTQVELFFSEEEMPNEILERRTFLRGDMFGMWKMMIQRMCVWKMEDGRSASAVGLFTGRQKRLRGTNM